MKLHANAQDEIQPNVAISAATLPLHCDVLASLQQRTHCATLSKISMQAKMGVRIMVLDPTPGCPASSVAVQIVGSFRDSAAVKQIAQLVRFCQHTSSMLMILNAGCPAADISNQQIANVSNLSCHKNSAWMCIMMMQHLLPTC